MKNCDFNLILLACLLAISSEVYCQDMLILPMPGQKLPPAQTTPQQPTNPNTNRNQTPRVNTNNNHKTPQNPAATPDNNHPTNNNGITANGTILPMPKANNGKNSSSSKTQQSTKTTSPTPKPTSGSNIIAVPSKQSTTSHSNNSQSVPNNQPLIAIPASNQSSSSQIQDDDFIPPPPEPIIAHPSKAVSAQTSKPAATSNNKSNTPTSASTQEEDLSSFFNDTDFPMPPDEFSASPDGEKVENLLPPTQQETTVSSNTTGESFTVYPKDTGSAIFMVMKSWKCDDYDAEKLIQQALEVYGKESDDIFQISGLNNLEKGFAVSVEEEDITLDELLDILASKSGNDWGADIPNKMIYVYPKGIKTESYVSWE